MKKTKRKRLAMCPFWSEISLKCNISTGGIFIPTDDHVEAYCSTLHFGSCSQFAFNTENQILLQERVRKTGMNRRKYIRFDASYNLTMVNVFELGEKLSHSIPKAKTIDLSKGGMRMAIDTPLADNTIIQFSMVDFSFDESFPQVLNDITGQVEWCNKQIDEPGYQAGISFKEAHIIETIGSYLEQHIQ